MMCSKWHSTERARLVVTAASSSLAPAYSELAMTFISVTSIPCNHQHKARHIEGELHTHLLNQWSAWQAVKSRDEIDAQECTHHVDVMVSASATQERLQEASSQKQSLSQKSHFLLELGTQGDKVTGEQRTHSGLAGVQFS